jgi:hypothetical protein
MLSWSTRGEYTLKTVSFLIRKGITVSAKFTQSFREVGEASFRGVLYDRAVELRLHAGSRTSQSQQQKHSLRSPDRGGGGVPVFHYEAGGGMRAEKQCDRYVNVSRRTQLRQAICAKNIAMIERDKVRIFKAMLEMTTAMDSVITIVNKFKSQNRKAKTKAKQESKGCKVEFGDRFGVSQDEALD